MMALFEAMSMVDLFPVSLIILYISCQKLRDFNDQSQRKWILNDWNIEMNNGTYYKNWNIVGNKIIMLMDEHTLIKMTLVCLR